MIRLGDVARVRQDLGPSIVRREDVRRVAVLTANISGRDLTGTVEDAREALDAELDLPSGYRLVFGGQFESAARSLAVIAVLSVVVLLATYGLLFFAFSSHRQALIVLVNLPLAVVGGVIAVALGKGVLSVASLLGFITLFGIATRNGVLMVTRYQQLLESGTMSLREAVLVGSEERMAPVLMTALTAGPRPGAAGSGRRAAGQRDPEPDGGGDSRRAAQLHGPQSGGGAGALRPVGDCETHHEESEGRG